MYCKYYQALIDRRKTWLLVGALRSCEGMVFERTLSKEENLFEFFVPQDMEHSFLLCLQYFQQQGIVGALKEMPNRIRNEKL